MMKYLRERSRIFNIRAHIDDPKKYRDYVMELFRVLGILALLAFILDDLIHHNYDEAVLAGIVVIFFLISFPLQNYVKFMPSVFRVGILLLITNFLYVLYHSSNPYIPPLWLLLIPLIVAFLFDTTEAIAWIVLTGVVAYLIILQNGNTDPAFQSFIGRIYFLYFGIGVLSIISDYIRGIIQNKVAETQDEIIRANEKISAQVITDSLTGVYNRAFLSSYVPEIIQRVIHRRIPLSIILFDIDQFKSINDDLGHIEGDQVLKEIAQVCLRQMRRSTDSLMRYGGDEFLVVLEGTTVTEAVEIAERIRLSIESASFSTGGSAITSSFGVAQLLDEDYAQLEGKAIRSLIARADQNLYRAKELGKNRVIY